MTDTTDVVVVGAGVIGLSIAWRLAQRGATVAVIDPAAGAGATGTAAGMLAPVTELHYGEEPLLHLNVASASRYPAFVAELEQLTGQDVGYRTTGTLSVGWDAADVATLRDLLVLQQRLGLPAQELSAADVRLLEPGVAPGLPGGVFAGNDHSVDPQRLHRALLTAGAQCGLDVRACEVVDVLAEPLRVSIGDATTLSCGRIVLAAGAWSGVLAQKWFGLELPVRPVKGQTVRVRGEPETVEHVVRGSVRGHPVYLVPRHDGEIVIGASSEEAGFDVRPRAGVVHDLLRDAQALLPAVAETELLGVSTALRPATPDNAPIIGATDVPGLVVATGHYRNGVLLAPITADAVAALVDDQPSDETATFGPQRFTTVGRMMR